MVKIIMDSGKEYQVENYDIQDVIDECYSIDEITPPIGKSIKLKKINVKFLKISDDIAINTNHISSIETV